MKLRFLSPYGIDRTTYNVYFLLHNYCCVVKDKVESCNKRKKITLTNYKPFGLMT